MRGQVQALGKEMNSTEFKNRYAGFTESYQQGSTLQNARTAMQEFNVTMMDIGAHTLPAVNGMLKDFKALMEGIRDILPKPIGGNASAGNTILRRAGEGAVLGTALGALFGGVGAVPGAAIGAGTGTAFGIAEQFMDNYHPQKSDLARDRAKGIGDAIRGVPGGTGGVFPGGTARAQLAPIKLDLNIDGRTLASTMSEIMAHIVEFSTQAPAADGIGLYNGGGQ